jgi:hypothetical protein
VTEVNIPIPEIPNIQTNGQSSQSQLSQTGIDHRVILFARGIEPTNKALTQYLDIVKPLVLDFCHDLRSIRFAIQLILEVDANNLGVQRFMALGNVDKFYHYFSNSLSNSQISSLCTLSLL